MLHSCWRFFIGSYFLNALQQRGMIIAITTRITNTNWHILKNDESVAMLKYFTLDKARSYRPIAARAWVTVHGPVLAC